MMWKIILLVLAAAFAVQSATMVGGWRDVDPNDAGVQTALNFAVVQHNRASNDRYLNKVSDVIKVQSQVVSGFNYRITVTMGRTPCLKNSATEVCTIHQDEAKAQLHNCTFTVWSQPWNNQIKLTKQEC